MKPDSEQEDAEAAPRNLKQWGWWKAILGGSLLVALLALIWTSWGKMEEVQSFSVDKPSSASSLGRNSEWVCWATDQVLVATCRNRLVQAFNAESGKEIWRKEFERGIDAVECSADHVYVAVNASYPYEKVESIRRLDLADGGDSTPKGIPQPFLPQALVWCEELKALCVVQDEAIWVYAPDLLSVTSRIPYCGTLPEVTRDGKLVLLLDASGGCTSINLGDGSTKHIHGPLPNPYDHTFVIDAPFLSNAFLAADGRFIRVVDNSWATGQIHFHDKAGAVIEEEDSKNGHAVAAVHWPTNRLVVSGTSKNLLLFSTSGDTLGKVRHATSDRTYSLAFSPSGSKIAALSADGKIKVFSVK